MGCPPVPRVVRVLLALLRALIAHPKSLDQNTVSDVRKGGDAAYDDLCVICGLSSRTVTHVHVEARGPLAESFANGLCAAGTHLSMVRQNRHGSHGFEGLALEVGLCGIEHADTQDA